MKKTYKIEIIFEEEEGKGCYMKTLVNGKPDIIPSKVRSWIGRNYFEQLMYLDRENIT